MSLFISFEGIDGAGKSTQIKRAAEWLSSEGRDVLVRREPGGTELGEAIRRILLDPHWSSMTPRCEFLLYSASRAQIVEEVVRPHLLKPRSVMILDRYMDSSTAYQGGGRELGIECVSAIHPFVTAGLTPDLTLYLEVDWKTSQHRKEASAPDRLELNKYEFFERVRMTYHQLCEWEPGRVKRIDASSNPDRVFEDIKSAIRPKLQNAHSS